MKSSSKLAIEPPRLPRQLTGVVVPILEDYGEVSTTSYSHVIWKGFAATSATFEQTRFQQVNFSQTRLPKLRLLDVQVETCDFTGAALEKARLQRVVFNGCRLMGLQLLEARCED